MAAQSGKDMLLKLDSTGSGSFLTVAGLRTRSLAFNAAAIGKTVDVVVVRKGKAFISLFGLDVNDKFKYPKYFSIIFLVAS